MQIHAHMSILQLGWKQKVQWCGTIHLIWVRCIVQFVCGMSSLQMILTMISRRDALCTKQFIRQAITSILVAIVIALGVALLVTAIVIALRVVAVVVALMVVKVVISTVTLVTALVVVVVVLVQQPAAAGGVSKRRPCKSFATSTA